MLQYMPSNGSLAAWALLVSEELAMSRMFTVKAGFCYPLAASDSQAQNEALSAFQKQHERTQSPSVNFSLFFVAASPFDDCGPISVIRHRVHRYPMIAGDPARE